MITIKLLWLIPAIPVFIILLLVVVLLTANVKIKIIGNNEDVVRLRFYLYGIPVFGFGVNDKPEPPHVRVSDYSRRRFERRRRRERRRAAARAAKRLRKAAAPADEQYKTVPDVLYIIKFILNVIKVFCQQFAGRLKIRLLRLEVSVATGDPASTAVLYGGVVQGVSYLMEFLRCNTDFDVSRHAPLCVEPNFCADTTQINICLTVNVHLRRLISLVFRSGLRSPADIRKFFKVKKNKNKKRPSDAA